MRFLDLGDHSIRIRVAGQGKRTVVFTADSPVLIEHHDALFDLLSPHVTVLCIDVPGFGFSAPAKDFGFTLDEFTEVLDQILERLGCASYVLSFPCFTGRSQAVDATALNISHGFIH